MIAARLRTRTAAALIPLALVASACSGDADPQQAVQDAFTATMADSFAYEVTLDADPDSLRDLGEAAGQAAGFIQGLTLSGERSGGTFSARLRVLGIDVLEIRHTGAGRNQLRAALPQIAALVGRADLVDPAVVTPRLQDLGVAPEVQTAVLAALAGEWVAIEGELTADAIQAALGITGDGASSDRDVRAAFAEAFGGSVDAAVARFVTATGTSDVPQGGTRIAVTVAFDEILRALGDLEAALDTGDAADLQGLRDQIAGVESDLPGSVDVRDGRVDAFRFDLAGAAGEQAAGSVLIEVALTEHGDVAAVEVAPGATTVSASAFLDAIATILAFTGAP